MRPLFKLDSKQSNEFHLKELVYIPNTISDWLILLIMILFFIITVIVMNYSLYDYQKVTNNNITKAEKSEIQTFEHLSDSTFFHYLIGTWETINGEYWSIDFLKHDIGVFKIYKNGINSKPTIIKIVVIKTNPSLGVVNFYNEENPKETGTISKIWNRDAIEINYSQFKKPVLLYFALLDLSSKPS